MEVNKVLNNPAHIFFIYSIGNCNLAAKVRLSQVKQKELCRTCHGPFMPLEMHLYHKWMTLGGTSTSYVLPSESKYCAKTDRSLEGSGEEINGNYMAKRKQTHRLPFVRKKTPIKMGWILYPQTSAFRSKAMLTWKACLLIDQDIIQ